MKWLNNYYLPEAKQKVKQIIEHFNSWRVKTIAQFSKLIEDEKQMTNKQKIVFEDSWLYQLTFWKQITFTYSLVHNVCMMCIDVLD